jgi:ATP-dependent Lhr-like helicase
VRTASVLGPDESEDDRAAAVAERWLARYGVVSRDVWRRERPAISWRSIYRQLKRLEFRGDARRGYFVRGLSGMQFALPSALELLRGVAAEPTTDAPMVVMSASDPANPYALPLPVEHRDSLARPRGRGALLVTQNGTVVLTAESRGRRVRVRPDATEEQVTRAARALGDHLPRGYAGRERDVIIQTIDGARATTSRHARAIAAGGFRSSGATLRRYASHT